MLIIAALAGAFILFIGIAVGFVMGTEKSRDA